MRYCQVAATFPMMQFSRAPWKVLSEQNQKICLDAVGLHGDLAEYIVQTAKRCAASGEPMIRNSGRSAVEKGHDHKTGSYSRRNMGGPCREKIP